MKPTSPKHSQSQPLRVLESDRTYLVTMRTQQSRLWFINNQDLEEEILYWLAKYVSKHGVRLYAYVLMGNHTHMVASFPRLNYAEFARDFHSKFSFTVRKHVSSFEGGTLLERRASVQALGTVADVEKYILYCAHQAPQSGLTREPKQYPGYNSFFDAVYGKSRVLKKLDYSEYRKYRCSTYQEREGYLLEEELRYERHPGLVAKYGGNYGEAIVEAYHAKLREIVGNREKEGLGFMGRSKLLRQRPGSKPIQSKQSERGSFRPLVLCSCAEARRQYLEYYFSVFLEFKKAVKRYFEGEFLVDFPPGTYRPPLIRCC